MHILIPALHRPTKPTGVCRHAVNLAQCLAYADPVTQITLLIGDWQRDYFARSFVLDSDKIQTVSINIKNSSVTRNQWFMFGLPRLAQQLQPDIIHMSFPFPFIRQWFKAKIASTIHDLYPYECPENFGYPQVWFNQLFLQQCVNNSDGLVCVSQYTLDTFQHYFPKTVSRKQTAVIYNVVDFDQIVAKRPQQLASSEETPFLLSVAQHRKNKNLDVLINAYARLLQQGKLKPATRLFLVGSSGPETPRLTELVQALNLEHQVLFIAGLEDSELRWLYEHAELFVMPSSTEGFCLPLAEALSLSCPAVCSDIPVFREVGSKQCRYFQLDENILDNLVEAILLESTVGSINRKRILIDRFSKEQICQHLLNFYSSLSYFSQVYVT